MMRWLVDVEVDMTAGSLSDEDLELLRGELYRGVTKDILGPRPSFVVERVASGLHITFPMTAGDEGDAALRCGRAVRLLRRPKHGDPTPRTSDS